MGSRFYVDLAFAVVQLLSHVRLFVTTHPIPCTSPWTAACPGLPIPLLEFAQIQWCYLTNSFSATPSPFIFSLPLHYDTSILGHLGWPYIARLIASFKLCKPLHHDKAVIHEGGRLDQKVEIATVLYRLSLISCWFGTEGMGFLGLLILVDRVLWNRSV